MSKVTLATLKSFLKKNEGKLYFQEHSRFDGMQDMVAANNKPVFKSAVGKFNPEDKAQLGYPYQIWCVRGGRDSLVKVTVVDQNGTYEGIYCYNSCGSWTVAVKVS